MFPSVANGDYSFLREVIREKRVTDIVVAGGDGTVSQVVGSLMDCKVNFGIIPCGSGNGLAYTAKIPSQLSRALSLIFNGSAAPIDGYMINDRFACMLSGLGFDAKVAYDFAQQPRRGLATYVTQVVKNFFSAKTYAFELEAFGKSFSCDAYFISIANSNQFGNNFTIAPKASLSDGLLDVVILTSQNKLSVLVETVRQVSGRNKLFHQELFGHTSTAIEKKKGIIYFQTPRLHLYNNSAAPLHIDGEPAETPVELNIVVREKCFWLIQPSSH